MKLLIPISWLVDMAGLEGEWETVGFINEHEGNVVITLRPSRVIAFAEPPDYKAADVVAQENPRPQPFVDAPGPETGWKEMLQGMARFLKRVT